MTDKTKIIYSLPDWNQFVDQLNGNRIIVLTDSNTSKYCLPLFRSKYLPNELFTHWEIEAGEENKSIDTVQEIWRRLMDCEADRMTLLFALGGGMISDVAGFVGSTFKRGIRTVYIPTTNLAMTDAALGGKTGINFLEVKNQIGTFHLPEAVLIEPIFLDSLPQRELHSGFAETIKHALIADPNLWTFIKQNALSNCAKDERIIAQSMQIKQSIVDSDSHDFGIRQSLNLGHTIGHALEGILQNSELPILHGEAIVFGILAELYLAKELDILSIPNFIEIENYLTANFHLKRLTTIDQKAIIQHMLNDKKNTKGKIIFSLISNIGEPKLGVHVSDELILKAIAYAHERLTNEVHS